MVALTSAFNQAVTGRPAVDPAVKLAEDKKKFFSAIADDNVATVAYMLVQNAGALDWKYSGDSVLDAVVRSGGRLVATAVLEACAKNGRADLLDQPNMNGMTPLTQALINKSHWIADAILAAGANPCAGDPMMTAAKWAATERNRNFFPGICDRINAAVIKRAEDTMQNGTSVRVKKMGKIKIGVPQKKAGSS